MTGLGWGVVGRLSFTMHYFCYYSIHIEKQTEIRLSNAYIGQVPRNFQKDFDAETSELKLPDRRRRVYAHGTEWTRRTTV
jgi:hypothetical protein